MARFWIFAAVAVAGLVIAYAGVRNPQRREEKYASPWRTPWDYEGVRGAAHWSELDHEYAPCAGREQAPIDIRDAQYAELPALRFVSQTAPLSYVANNGHTIRVNYRPGNGNMLLFGDERYELTQFHFHRPSEETIDGTPYDMETHLMYRTSEGKLAGVTVFITAGRPNSTVEKVWQHMPRVEGQSEVRGVTISPAGLLPEDTKQYFLYTGSLTAPPCTEGVTWFVLENPVEISKGQIDAFAELYPHNVRPVQPLNGRVVQRSRR